MSHIDTDDIRKVIGSKVKVTDSIFQKRTFPAKTHDRPLAGEDHLPTSRRQWVAV